MLKTKAEKERGYSDKSHALIEYIRELNLRRGWPLHKAKAEEAIAEAYWIAELPIPRFEWRVDVLDKDFASAASVASAASAVGVARAAAVDWDFDYFLEEHEYLLDHPGNENDHKALNIYQQFLKAKEAGLGYLADYDTGGVCYLLPAPQIILNERDRYHSETQPAISWKDGLACYFLHGVSFTKDLWRSVVDKTITSKEALNIQSSDQRAIALQYIGGEKLMADFNGKVIATDEYGELIELTDLKDGDGNPWKYLKAWNPEANRFVFLRTWPDILTPAAAEAKSYRLERWGMKYQPTSRT